MAIRSESLLSLSAFKPLHYNFYAPFFCAGAEIVGWHSCVRFAPYCKLYWTIALPLGKAGRKAFSIIYKAVRKRDVRENMRQAFSIIQTVAPIFRGAEKRGKRVLLAPFFRRASGFMPKSGSNRMRACGTCTKRFKKTHLRPDCGAGKTGRESLSIIYIAPL